MLKDQFYESNVSNIRINFANIYFNDIDINGIKEKKSFKIELHDPGGQERFRSVTFKYIKYANGIILVYDITNKNNFDHVDELER